MSELSGLSLRLSSLGVLGMAAGGTLLSSAGPAVADTHDDASGAIIILTFHTVEIDPVLEPQSISG